MRLTATTFFFIYFVVTSTCWQSIAKGHEFERGHIERSIDIVIRDRTVNVRYAIGLSDTTMVDWLVKENSISEAEQQRLRKLIAEFENDKQPSDSEAEQDVEPAEFQTDLMGRFKEELGQKICDSFELICNDEKLEFTQQLSSSPRRHVVLEICLTSRILDAETAELIFVDRNFLDVVEEDTVVSPETTADATDAAAASDQTTEPDSAQQTEPAKKFLFGGDVRLACRVKGGAVQLSSNVAPIVARSKVTDVDPLDTRQRVKAATISTKLGFVE